MTVINTMMQELNKRSAAPGGGPSPRTPSLAPRRALRWRRPAFQVVLLAAVVAGAGVGYVALNPAPVVAPAALPAVAGAPSGGQAAPEMALAAPASLPASTVTGASASGAATVDAVAQPGPVVGEAGAPSVTVAAKAEAPAAALPTAIKTSPQAASPAAKAQVPVAAPKALAKPASAAPDQPSQSPGALMAQGGRSQDAQISPASANAVAERAAAGLRPGNSPQADSAPAGDSVVSVGRGKPAQSLSATVAQDYRSALETMNQGHAEQAIKAFAGVLRLDPKHLAARQSLVFLLTQRGQTGEAQTILREGLTLIPENAAWAMLLARMQAGANDAASALETLDKTLPHARNRADYHALFGTVLQMLSRHQDAITHYQIAVRIEPQAGRWLAGLGISLDEQKRLPEAREAFQRALATRSLDGELQAFVERKLKLLQ